jgi:hypothetical protein
LEMPHNGHFRFFNDGHRTNNGVHRGTFSTLYPVYFFHHFSVNKLTKITILKITTNLIPILVNNLAIQGGNRPLYILIKQLGTI